MTLRELMLRKLGSGSGGGASVQPDWNQNNPTAPDYVKNRTHWKETILDITWDGNTEGLPYVTGAEEDGAATRFYRVSSETPNADDFVNCTLTYYFETSEGESGEEAWTTSEDDVAQMGSVIVAGDGALVALEANAEFDGVVFPAAGVYLAHYYADEGDFSVKQFVSHAITEKYHRVPNEYLPRLMCSFYYDNETLKCNMTHSELSDLKKAGFPIFANGPNGGYYSLLQGGYELKFHTVMRYMNPLTDKESLVYSVLTLTDFDSATLEEQFINDEFTIHFSSSYMLDSATNSYVKKLGFSETYEEMKTAYEAGLKFVFDSRDYVLLSCDYMGYGTFTFTVYEETHSYEHNGTIYPAIVKYYLYDDNSVGESFSRLVELPYYSSSDTGKVLGLGSDGNLVWVDIPTTT